MALMQKRLIDYDVTAWVKDFLTQLNEVKKFQESRELKFITKKLQTEIVSRFKKSKVRHLFLDYDGTLVPFARLPQEAMPGKSTLKLLYKLTSYSNTHVTIISGRDSKVLDDWFKEIPCNLVAEHGASIKLKGKPWSHGNSIDQTWKPMIKPSFELFVQRSPGAFIEEKNHTLAWHYRNVEAELGFLRSRDLLDTLLHLVRNAQLQVIDGNKVIEVRVSGVDKGVAATKLLNKFPAEFVMAIGDDKTDEDMFHALANKAITIKVGTGMTQAQYALPNQNDVLELLSKLNT
jgi:trehalose 6-phosphate synthase/phosphatase